MRRVRECAGKGSKASAFTGIDEVLGPPSSEGLYHSLPADNWSCQRGGGTSFPVSKHNLTHLAAAVHLSIYWGGKILIDNATFFPHFFLFSVGD